MMVVEKIPMAIIGDEDGRQEEVTELEDSSKERVIVTVTAVRGAFIVLQNPPVSEKVEYLLREDVDIDSESHN